METGTVGASQPLLRCALVTCVLFGLLSLMSGCGLVSAVANPKVAWAIQDPAGMAVVVRREDAADTTAKQVDRILAATAASPDSDWLATVGPKPDDAAGDMKALAADPMYAKTHPRVVPAEVWARTLGDVQSTGGSSPNLLAMISGDLGDAYAAITAKQAEIADIETQIAAEKEAKDAKGASDADKKEHDKNVDDLKKKKSKLEDDVAPLQKKFVETAKTEAAKASADTRKAVGPALVNLREAVDQASISAGAAAVRYPLAAKSLPDAVKEVVPVIIADIVEEQTGHRPILDGFKPDVSLDGLDVKVTINGLEAKDLGKLSLGDLTTETLKRTKAWVLHATTLLADISATKTRLDFEADTLDAIVGGFSGAGWTKVEAAKIPDEKDPKVASATAKVRHHVATADSSRTARAGVAEAQKGTTPVARVARAADGVAKAATTKIAARVATGGTAGPTGPTGTNATSGTSATDASGHTGRSIGSVLLRDINP
jgi:hypothetical protein